MGRRLNGEPAKKIDLYEIAKAAGADSIYRVNAFDLEACKNAAITAADEKGVRVIIFEGPCIDIVPKGDPLFISKKDCTGCTRCVVKFGCPALSMQVDAEADNKTGKLASIDPVLCTGCGLCVKVCPSGAIGNAH
jgi:indolepyruvate ferredoxin oxidoreductase alpha subunit